MTVCQPLLPPLPGETSKQIFRVHPERGAKSVRILFPRQQTDKKSALFCTTSPAHLRTSPEQNRCFVSHGFACLWPYVRVGVPVYSTGREKRGRVSARREKKKKLGFRDLFGGQGSLNFCFPPGTCTCTSLNPLLHHSTPPCRHTSLCASSEDVNHQLYFRLVRGHRGVLERLRARYVRARRER